MSLNRTLAGLIDAAGDVKSASLDNAASLTVYSTKEDLPSSGMSSGDQAYVTGNSRFYISNGSGWYNVALVNATPSLSIDPTGAIALSVTGDPTTITLTATDSDNAVAGLTYTVESDGNFSGLATISQDSSVFTITPLSEDSATTSSSTLTFKASDGISFGSGTRTLTLSFSVANSKYTAFLLQADSASLDNPILDVSSNALTISKNGNVFSNSFSPYHPGGYAIQYNGIADYITAASSADFDIGGTGDWSLEGWLWWDPSYSAYNYTRFMGFGPYYNDTKSLGIILNDNDNSGYLTVYWNDGALGRKLISSQTVAKGEWVHIAVCRQGNAIALFYNGTRVANNASYTGSIQTGNTNFWVGHDLWGTSSEGFIGYHTDIRVVNGSSAYDPTSSSITVPTGPLQTITNTVFHTGTLPYIGDKSSSNHDITVNSVQSKKRFGPYDYLGYTKTNHGGSVYFDGSGDYLTGASDNGLIASGNGFTVEGWVYWTNLRSANEFVVAATTGANNYEPYWFIGSSTSNNWRYSWGNAASVNSSIPIIANQWNHFAMVVTSGGAGTLYINGKSKATTTGISLNGSATGVAVSHVGGGPGVGTLHITGYVADVRYVNNSSVYTAEFTPPVAPLSAISGTQFLTCKNQGTIYDKAGSPIDVILDYGQPSSPAITSSSTQRKFTTSNSIVLANNAEGIDVTGIEIGTAPFTVEGWFYHTLTNQAAIYFSSQTDNTFQIKSDYIDANRWFYTYVASTGYNFQYTSGDTMLNTWNHIVLQRNSSNVLQMFLNGTSLGTHTSVTGNVNTSNDLQLFAGAEGGGYTNFEGYVQDFRISVGIARYSGNFTPPTAQFDG